MLNWALTWGLAPLLAIAAIGLQFAVDVPHHEMIERKSKSKKRRTTTAARTPRAKKPPRKRSRRRSRGAAYTKRLRKAWSGRALADEPKDPRFAVHHEALLRALTRKAEAAVAPVAQIQVTCHTIRCDFQICAPPKLADAIAERIPKFSIGRRSLWHELREIEADPGPNDSRPPRAGQVCHRWIVDFAIERPNIRDLKLAD